MLELGTAQALLQESSVVTCRLALFCQFSFGIPVSSAGHGRLLGWMDLWPYPLCTTFRLSFLLDEIRSFMYLKFVISFTAVVMSSHT